MKKNQALFKYSCFYSFGQYQAEKNISAYIFMVLFEAGIWAVISLFLHEQINSGAFLSSAAFIIPICLKCFFAIIEKYGELSIGFNLKKYFNIKNVDIVVLRFFSKLLNISEYFFLASLAFFSFTMVDRKRSLLCFVTMVLFYYIIYEILAYVSYKYDKFESPIKQILLFMVLQIVYQILPVAINYLNLNSLMIKYIKISIITISVLLCIFIISKLLFGHRKSSCKNSKSIDKKKIKLKSGVPNTIGILMKKDFAYLVKDKKSIWIFPVLYLLIFYLIAGIELIQYILPIYFPLEFGISFGFNYFGHDNESFINIVLAPVSKEKIIIEKNIIFLSLNGAFILLFYILGCFVGAVPIGTTYNYFSFAFIALSVILLLCIPLSIKYYYKVNGKAKYTFRFIFISLALFSMFSILNSVLIIINISQIILFAVSSFLLLFAIYWTCINVKYLARKLEKNERTLLNKYL